MTTKPRLTTVFICASLDGELPLWHRGRFLRLEDKNERALAHDSLRQVRRTGVSNGVEKAVRTFRTSDSLLVELKVSGADAHGRRPLRAVLLFDGLAGQKKLRLPMSDVRAVLTVAGHPARRLYCQWVSWLCASQFLAARLVGRYVAMITESDRREKRD